jgi:nucleoside-diphosphate-sugar epimerase
MSLFVTGATGFLGRNFVETLVRHFRVSAPIRCLVRTPEKAEFLRKLPSVEIIEGDLLQPETYQHVLHDAEFVFHIGALVSLKNGDAFYEANTEATRTLVEAVRASHPRNLRRFVLVSTIAAVDRPYGSAARSGPITEATPPQPNTDYGKSKLQAEAIVQDSGLPYTILRPGYIFGPYPRQGSSMDRIIYQLREGRPETRIPFPGRASMIYVEDMADLMWLSAQATGTRNEVFMTGYEAPVSVSQYFSDVCRHLYQPWRPYPMARLWLPLLKAYIYQKNGETPLPRILFEDHFVCSSRKLIERIGWEPRIGYDEGVARTIDWYKRLWQSQQSGS